MLAVSKKYAKNVALFQFLWRFVTSYMQRYLLLHHQNTQKTKCMQRRSRDNLDKSEDADRFQQGSNVVEFCL